MKNKVVINTIALYGMNFAKILFPLATLPYLTRVLSLDGYGLVVYVKAIMQYFQLFIDFGFILSGTRDIVIAKKNRANINYVVSRVFFANLILVTIAAVALAIIVETSEMLRTNALFVVLSFVNIALTILLFDYIFRGFEKMHVLTSRFVLMKVISTLLTFIFIKSDADILLIPIIDILGSLVAIFFVILQLKKLQIKIIAVPIKKAIQSLKDSAVFFVSNMATAAFTALDTVVIGAVLSTKDVAYWGLCTQICGGIQALYTPVVDGVYPHMIQTKNFRVIKNVLLIFMPLITLGCLVLFITSGFWLGIIGGHQYIGATSTLRILIPVLFFGFTSMIFGWPALGSIGKEKETTSTTIFSGVVQIVGLLILYGTGNMSLINISLVRILAEFSLTLTRMLMCIKFRREFSWE